MQYPFYFDAHHILDLANPHHDWDVEWIARMLSRTYRFGGKIPVDYSVAQHSTLCALYVLDRHADQPDVHLRALQALLHDAPEAITGDIITPIKRYLGERLADLEGNLWADMTRHFQIPREWYPSTKEADLHLLNREFNQWLAHEHDAHAWFGDAYIPHTKPITVANPQESAQGFLRLYQSLMVQAL